MVISIKVVLVTFRNFPKLENWLKQNLAIFCGYLMNIILKRLLTLNTIKLYMINPKLPSYWLRKRCKHFFKYLEPDKDVYCPFSSLFFNTGLELPATAIKQEKEIKKQTHRKGGIQIISVADYMNLFIEKTIRTDNLVKLQDTEWREKSVADSELTEKKTRRANSSTTATKTRPK